MRLSKFIFGILLLASLFSIIKYFMYMRSEEEMTIPIWFFYFILTYAIFGVMYQVKLLMKRFNLVRSPPPLGGG